MTASPDYIVTTGDFIQEWMEDREINAAELARRLGTSPKHVSELLNGKVTLSPTMAISLERVTGTPARVWGMYEAGYREDLARREIEDGLAASFDEAKRFPLAYLREWGYVTASARDQRGTVTQLLGLLGVASFDAWHRTWEKGSVAYRRSAVGREDLYALATWLVIAERGLLLQDLHPFDREGLRRLIPQLRSLTREDPRASVASAQELLASVGVTFRLVPGVPGLGLHGATRWIGGHPLLQLSLLWKSDDQLWFTFFHELGHVLLHGERGLHLEGEDTAAEKEADRWASEILIPAEYEPRLPTRRDAGAIRELADELGIAPSIVLGRAQRRSGDWKWGHDLRRKLEFSAPEAA